MKKIKCQICSKEGIDDENFQKPKLEGFPLECHNTVRIEFQTVNDYKIEGDLYEFRIQYQICPDCFFKHIVSYMEKLDINYQLV